jgi:hypothetical protein
LWLFLALKLDVCKLAFVAQVLSLHCFEVLAQLVQHQSVQFYFSAQAVVSLVGSLLAPDWVSANDSINIIIDSETIERNNRRSRTRLTTPFPS